MTQELFCLVIWWLRGEFMSFKIFSGNSNLKFSEKLSKKLGVGLSDLEISYFKDGEISVFVKEDVTDCDCVVVQSLSDNANDNLIEMVMISDALKRANARSILAVVPYLGYARQDRRCRVGEPVSSKVVASIISSYFDKVLVLDLHVPQIEAYFDVPTMNISCFELFIEDIKNIKSFSNENFVIVSPDVGALKKVRSYADELGCPLVIIEKIRRRANESKVVNIIGEVESKNLIIIDDIIDTGGTICNVARLLSEKGARCVYVYASHAVCSENAIENLSTSCIDSIKFSNSILIDEDKILGSKFEIIDVSSIFAYHLGRFFLQNN